MRWPSFLKSFDVSEKERSKNDRRFLADVLRDGCTFFNFKELGSHVNLTGLDVDTQSYDGKEWTQGQWSWAYNKIINLVWPLVLPTFNRQRVGTLSQGYEAPYNVYSSFPVNLFEPPRKWKAKTKKVRKSTTKLALQPLRRRRRDPPSLRVLSKNEMNPHQKPEDIWHQRACNKKRGMVRTIQTVRKINQRR